MSLCLHRCHLGILVCLETDKTHARGHERSIIMRMHAGLHMDGCDMIEDMVALLTCILDLGKYR